MQQHLIRIFNRFSMRKDLVNRLFVDVDSYEFRGDVLDEDRWSYYIWVCRELKIKDRVIRHHGMDSNKASSKKVGGHSDEKFFEKYGFEILKGTNKTDLLKSGKSYASVKGGVKIQWGMHVINNLPERFQKLFGGWISTYEKNYVSLNERTNRALEIVKILSNKEVRGDLINYYFRKDENIPFLIVKDVNTMTYYEILYTDLIDVLVNNLDFYITKDKVKINARIDLGEKNKRVFFEIEPRTDVNNSILMHGLSERVIKIIKYYKIDVKKTYQQDPNPICGGKN